MIFDQPSNVIKALHDADKVVMMQTEFKEMPGREFVHAVFHAQLLTALRDNLFRDRSPFMDDLEAIAGANSQCAVGDASCGNGNIHVMAHQLLSMHLFQLDKARTVRNLLRDYTLGKKPMEAVMYELRYQACEDLHNFVATAFNKIASSTRQKGVTRTLMEQLVSSRIKVLITTFGAYADFGGIDVPRVQLTPFAKALNAMMDAFRNQIKYTYSIDKCPVYNASGKPSSNGKRGTGYTPMLPKLQAALESLLSKLVADGTGSGREKGALIQLNAKLSSLAFDYADATDLINAFSEATVKPVEARVPVYFPINQLRNAQPGGAVSAGSNARGLRLGSSTKAISGGAATLALAWGDYSVSLIYIVKLVRFLTQLGALWVAVKVFREAYVRNVYAGNKDPPQIRNLLFLFLGIDMTMQLFFITMIVLLTAPGSNPAALVNDAFMSRLLVDEMAATVMIAILGSIVSSFVWRKTYFQYKTDGLGTIKCYADMMVGVCATMVVVPFFLLA